MGTFPILDEKTPCYSLKEFCPHEITPEELKADGIEYPIDDYAAKELRQGNVRFNDLYHNHSLAPELTWSTATTDPTVELEVHNYTGICPTDVLEVTPSAGSCSVACQYCLVTDGNHRKPIMVYTNYPEKLAQSLERNKDRSLFYYFSPKTEAFSEPHLYTGVAHEILRAFDRHFQRHPSSACRIFIATKAGPKQMEVTHQGDNLYQWLARLAPWTQVNGSIGIMPTELRDALEPHAADVDARLEVLQRCRQMGLWAEAVLCQPLLLPYLTEENISSYMAQLARYGVRHIKPEFLTTEIANLVVLAQYIHHFDPDQVANFFRPYLRPENRDHIKQRSRLAPDREVCIERLGVIHRIAAQYGISVSLCNWVKRELGRSPAWNPAVDQDAATRHYRCLGYQMDILRSTVSVRSSQP